MDNNEQKAKSAGHLLQIYGIQDVNTNKEGTGFPKYLSDRIEEYFESKNTALKLEVEKLKEVNKILVKGIDSIICLDGQYKRDTLFDAQDIASKADTAAEQALKEKP